MPRTDSRPRAVVALGGNAITLPGEEGTVAQDLANLARSLDGIATLLGRGYALLLTHGNGPQVGNQMIRVELSRGAAPDLPLDVMGADIQGGLGYMIERVLRDKLRARGLDLPVCCVLSMVEVRADDPSLAEPTKFVGPVFGASQLEACRARGWVMKEDRGRGWRRVVPSPEPIGIVERRELAMLLDAGAVVISGGGGGIPVCRAADGTLTGFEGVIDKDHASAVLALEIGAPELFILTGVEQVMLDYATPAARAVARMTAAEARGYLAAGQFPAGSMGPKIEAACRFVERGGTRCLITGIGSLVDALVDGKTGTWIVP